MIERGEVYAGVASFSLLPVRTEVADFLMPLGFLLDGVYYKADKSTEDWLTYLYPFSQHSWIVVGVFIFVMAFTFYVTANVGNLSKEDYKFNLALSIMIAIHGAANQGAPYVPNKLSARIVFFISFLSGFVTYVSYSASLTSFLAIKHHRLPFTNAETMYHDSEYNIVTVEGTSYIDIFQV